MSRTLVSRTPGQGDHASAGDAMARHALAAVATFDPARRRTDGTSRSELGRPSAHTLERQKRILGINVTRSHCDCLKEIPDQIQWAQLAASVYDRCGKDPKNKTGSDVETCFDADMTKRGIKTSVAGTTSATGKVKINKSKGPCGRLWDHATKLHERVHAATQKQLKKLHGAGTPAFDSAWDNARNWGDDEVKAYGAEIPFYQAVAAHLGAICPKQSSGSKAGGHGGAILGGVSGAILGASIGAFGGPLGALVGGAIGALGGALIGSLFD